MADRSKLLPPGGSAPGSGNLFGSLFGSLMVRDPRARVFVLVGLLLLMLAIMFGLRQYASTGEAKQVSRDVPAPEVPGVVFTGVPVFDMEIANRIADDGPDSRRRWPSEAAHYLLLEAANTPAVHGYRKNLLPLTPGSAAEIDKDSRPWRFKYVRFRGEIEYMREEDYEAVYGPPSPPQGLVRRGRVRVAEGDGSVRVVFVTLAMPTWIDRNEPTPEVKLIQDGWVRGRGILVGNYVDTTGGEEVPALLVVATDVERDYETVPVDSMKDIPFDVIEDDPADAVDQAGRDTLAKEYPRPLYRLLKLAEGRAGGPGAARRAEEKLVPQAISTREQWEEIVGQAAKYRGRYYGGFGAMADSPLRYGPETITPNDAGVEECLNGWIVTDQQKLFQFLAPAALDRDWLARTRIRWEGYFYKTKLYHARDGTERYAPVFVLTVLEEVKLPRPGRLVPILLAGGFILGIAIMIFLIVREDRTKESYRRLRRRRVAAE
jgi:hypothetical protein